METMPRTPMDEMRDANARVHARQVADAVARRAAFERTHPDDARGNLGSRLDGLEFGQGMLIDSSSLGATTAMTAVRPGITFADVNPGGGRSIARPLEILGRPKYTYDGTQEAFVRTLVTFTDKVTSVDVSYDLSPVYFLRVDLKPTADSSATKLSAKDGYILLHVVHSTNPATASIMFSESDLSGQNATTFTETYYRVYKISVRETGTGKTKTKSLAVTMDYRGTILPFYN